jgi:hypothetical protein
MAKSNADSEGQARQRESLAGEDRRREVAGDDVDLLINLAVAAV